MDYRKFIYVVVEFGKYGIEVRDLFSEQNNKNGGVVIEDIVRHVL